MRSASGSSSRSGSLAEPADGSGHDVGVGRRGDAAGARAGGDAELGRRARRLADGPARRRRAAPQGDDGLDGLGDPLGRSGRREGAEVEGAVVTGDPHHREARERLVERELEVGVALPGGALAVEAGLVLVDQAHLADGGLERGRARLVVDGLRLAQQLADLPPRVAREVRPDPGPQVGGLADVEHAPTAIAEQVDARRAGQGVGERELRGLGVAGDGRQREEVVEAGDAEAGRPLEQEVEQVAGGQRVVERPVAGSVVEAEVRRQRAELAVRHLVAHQSAGERRACRSSGWSAAAARCGTGRPGGSRGRSARCGRR